MQNADKTTNIVIAALGGEGGGTLASWIEHIAYNAGWHAQTTSIAGVAQRTGATIYYIELFPGRESGKVPIMSMFPASGDIDIAISSEIAEAGRLIQRGFCSKDRTTLIASDHHVFGITEKVILGDGRADTQEIAAVAAQQCKKLVSYDMRDLAERHNTVISATLLGALAGSKALPFNKADYHAVISASGKMVENNTAAFNASYNKAAAPSLVVEKIIDKTDIAKPSAQKIEVEAAPKQAVNQSDFSLPKATTANGEKLLSKIKNGFPASCHEFITLGVEKLLDYQDYKYAVQYLEELAKIVELDSGENEHELTRETARHLALWMSFEDTARVAQIKTRAARVDKIRTEVKADQEQIYHLTEFFAPRLEEICQPLPAGIAKAIIASPLCRKLLSPLTKGKRLRTDTILTFSLLRLMAFTRKWRRKQYTYQHEHQQITLWLAQIKHYANNDIASAIEIAKSARIVKGYGKTRERGSEQIDKILSACAKNTLDSNQISQLVNEALSDEMGETFESALAKIS